MAIVDLSPLADPRPFLAPLFTDFAVLQRERLLPVWGWDAPGTRVRVALAGQVAEGVADRDGRWSVTLQPLVAGGPHQLEVQGTQRVVRQQILVGEVWLCSGQSNMEMGVAMAADATEAIRDSDVPGLRLAMCRNRTSLDPCKDVDVQWKQASPTTVVEGGWGGFSAAALAFGKALRQRLGVPVGLIQSAWGGSGIEAWVSAGQLAQSPLNRTLAETHLAAVNHLRQGDEQPWKDAMRAWWATNDLAGNSGDWKSAGFADGAWGTVTLPTGWESAAPPCPNQSGIIWFRRTIEIPADWAGHGATLRLGPVGDSEQVFLDGHDVGMRDGWILPHHHPLAPGVLTPGVHTLAIRVVHCWTVWVGGSQELVRDDGVTLALSGTWKYATSRPWSWSEQTKYPRFAPRDMDAVAALRNALLTPLAPYALRGALWYQGETNIGRAPAYREALAAMIRDWRELFANPDLAVGVVQLAGWRTSPTEQVDSSIARLREVQVPVGPMTFYASAIDVGHPTDVHPPRKTPVGQRLARGALDTVYRIPTAWTGPRCIRAERRGPAMVIETEGASDGLRLRPDAPEGADWPAGFTLAGEDRVFHPAEARIDGTTVVVTSAAVAAPVAVRYAWADHPRTPLADGEDLPALPWRSDDW